MGPESRMLHQLLQWRMNAPSTPPSVRRASFREGLPNWPLYPHIRPHCVVGEGSKIGAFVQLKNCNLGKGTGDGPDLTYVGDSDVGDDCNFWPAAPSPAIMTALRSTAPSSEATCSWVGNTNFVPPVQIGDGAFVRCCDHGYPGCAPGRHGHRPHPPAGERGLGRRRPGEKAQKVRGRLTQHRNGAGGDSRTQKY